MWETIIINLTPQWNDYTFEMAIYLVAWLDECMRNESKGLLKSIYSIASGFITYNHTVMHSYARKEKIGIINR